MFYSHEGMLRKFLDRNDKLISTVLTSRKYGVATVWQVQFAPDTRPPMLTEDQACCDSRCQVKSEADQSEADSRCRCSQSMSYYC
jgi:hypothetical protein